MTRSRKRFFEIEWFCSKHSWGRVFDAQFCRALIHLSAPNNDYVECMKFAKTAPGCIDEYID